MCTSWDTHPAAASFDDGASARLATSANSTRSVAASRRVLPSRVRIVLAIPSRAHSASSTHAPPSGRDSVNDSPGRPPACAPASPAAAEDSPSSRDSDPISRSTAARSRSSARPKLYNTFIRAAFAAGSHSLCASCRYRTTVPSLFRRDDVLTNMSPDTTRNTRVQAHQTRQVVSLGVFGRLTTPQAADLHVCPAPCPRTPISCGTQVEARQDVSRRPDGELLADDLKDERAEGIQPRELVDPRARTEVRMRVDQARENRI